MLSGRIGGDYHGPSTSAVEPADDYIEEAQIVSDSKPEYKVGIKPVDNGIVIDHIGRGRQLQSIWNQIDKIRRIMQLNCRSSHGVYHTNDPKLYKGIMSLPDVLSFDDRQIKMLGAIAPGCTVNIIQNARILKKYRLHMPPRVYNFDEISCKNESCISSPVHFQHVKPVFHRAADSQFICRYCEHIHKFEEIWDV